MKVEAVTKLTSNPDVAVHLHLLLVEDDRELGTAIETGLIEQGFVVQRVRTGRDARARALALAFDLVVLDINLPDVSGLALCAELRTRGVTAPILLLTARDSVADRVAGLERGADDYLTKPFAFAELVARLRALARRAPLNAGASVSLGDLRIDFGARRVLRAGAPLELTAKEFALLEVLARSAGEVISRPTITAHVWDDNHDPFDNVLEVLVRRLRRKLDGNHATSVIQTVRGMGYRLDP